MGRKIFRVGILVMTRNVHDRFETDYEFMKFVVDSFARFRRGDWGNLCKEDKIANDKIWIITEWDRSTTTILFPEDYKKKKK